MLAAINVLFHIVRLALGVTLEQAMDANWVIRPAVRPPKLAAVLRKVHCDGKCGLSSGRQCVRCVFRTMLVCCW